MFARRVRLFFVLAFAISWTAALLLHLMAKGAGLANFAELMEMAETTFELSQIRDRLPLPTSLIWLLTRIVDFGPSIAAIVTAAIVGGRDEVGELLRSPRVKALVPGRVL